MSKQFVLWKTLRDKNVVGEPIDLEIPHIIDVYLKGALLSKILKMEKKTPIYFEDAVRKATKELFKADTGHERGQNFWYLNHFIEFIAEQGFHIELTGDEFELPYQAKSAI